MEQFIDLERYPIADPGSAPYDALVARCRTSLAEDGAHVFEGFLKDDSMPRAIAEIEPALPHAFYKAKRHSPYLVADDPAFSADHPRNRKQATSSATLGYDHVPADSVINRIYTWEPLQRFLADVLRYEALYPYADPLTPLNVLVYGERAETGWHFDLPPFVVTLMLQQGIAGGVYEYAPFIRSDDDENYEGVAAVLEGRSDAVRELRQPPGALVIFRGNRTLHRVTPVIGERPRLVAVFSYARERGTMSDEHNRLTFYGRVA